MWKDFSDENTARDFAKKVGGAYRKSKTTSCWVVMWDETECAKPVPVSAR